MKIEFPPAKPDTTFEIEMRGKDLIASQKTFKEALGGKPEQPYALISSRVTAYASVPVDYLSNDITINLNKNLIIEDIKKDLPSDKRPWKYLIYGLAGGLVISEVSHLVR